MVDRLIRERIHHAEGIDPFALQADAIASLPNQNAAAWSQAPARGADMDTLHMRIQETLRERGRVCVSTTTPGGRRAFRFCATSYLSEPRHVDRLLQEIRAAAVVEGPARVRV